MHAAKQKGRDAAAVDLGKAQAKRLKPVPVQTSASTSLYGERSFYNPNKPLRVLTILEHLRRAESCSQHQLGRAAGLSSAMVNTYLKRMQALGLIRYEPVDRKNYEYILTQAGEREAADLFSGFCAELVRIYTGLKQAIRQKFNTLAERGHTRVALFGASETCEVVLTALQDTNFSIVAVVDNDPAKHGQRFHSHVVSPPVTLEVCNYDAIVITSFGRQDEIHEQLKTLAETRGVALMRL